MQGVEQLHAQELMVVKWTDGGLNSRRGSEMYSQTLRRGIDLKSRKIRRGSVVRGLTS